MKWRILVVDDEEDVRLIVKTTLEANYEVLEAHDGLDALEKLERYEPDFILMDVMMPLMNGFEACEAIRKSPRFSEVPVMFLSALGSREDMKKGYSAGANLYLTKPFDPPRLLKNIDIFFERTPPRKRRRRYTIEQLLKAEKEGHEPKAPGSGEYELPREERRPPRETPAKTPAPVEAETPVPAQSGLLPRVMVVDDDPEMCTLMRMSLMDVCEVVFANDGMMAIERLVKYQPDILIIDVMLPKMNGYQLLQSLRTNRAFQRMPIMMCSAKGADRDINMAKRIGADDYLVKPFSATELLKKVSALQQKPGFRIRPKSYSIQQIQELETPQEDQDVFASEEDLKRRSQAEPSAKVLGRFLAREGKKEALEHEAEAEKPKRRLFGLGGGNKE